MELPWWGRLLLLSISGLIPLGVLALAALFHPEPDSAEHNQGPTWGASVGLSVAVFVGVVGVVTLMRYFAKYGFDILLGSALGLEIGTRLLPRSPGLLAVAGILSRGLPGSRSGEEALADKRQRIDDLVTKPELEELGRTAYEILREHRDRINIPRDR